MGHAECRAEHIADAVACSHRHPRSQRPGREPGADLAIHPGVEIAGVRLHARQRLRQHRQSLQRLRVAVRMRLARAQALHTMVDRADAGRKPQPFRGMHGHRGIEDGGARHRKIVAQHLLDLGAQIGDAGDGAEFAAGNGRRHADLAHGRRVHVGRDVLAGPDPVDILDAANVVGEADLHRLGAVGDRSPAYGDDQVGVGGARLFGGGNDGFAGRMRRHRVEGRHATRPEGLADFLDLVGLTVERAANHQEGAGQAQAVHLPGGRLGGGRSENHLVHGAENDTPLVHDDCPPRRFWFCCSLFVVAFCFSLGGNLADSLRGGEP